MPFWRSSSPLAKSIRLGNPLDAATEMGPLTSALHRDRVLAYVDVARGQGGEVLAGASRPARPSFRVAATSSRPWCAQGT